ncbi:MAG: nicotinic acid mononucleotide adenyltransferase, partial [Gelidibacter sp.]|nr:nicotinic acid mononucleotide adenyltransferase [Gelidibacter sp.]
DYDYFDNEHFELSVINDQRIELYHPASGTYYEFTGRGYIQYLKNADGSTTNRNALTKSDKQKKRKQKTAKKENPRVNNRS